MAQPAHQKEVFEDVDPFMESMNRLLNWMKANQKEIVVWTSVAAVVIAAAIGGSLYYNHAQNRAAMLLGKAITAYSAARANNGPFSAYEAIKGDLKEVMDKYGYTDSADLALIQYAGVCCFSGDYEKAVDAYQKALDKYGDKPILKDVLESGLAYSYAGKKDYKNAVLWFKKITEDPAANAKDEAFFNLGLIYGKTGRKEKSAAAFKKIVSDFPDSLYSDAAKQKISG